MVVVAVPHKERLASFQTLRSSDYLATEPAFADGSIVQHFRMLQYTRPSIMNAFTSPLHGVSLFVLMPPSCQNRTTAHRCGYLSGHGQMHAQGMHLLSVNLDIKHWPSLTGYRCAINRRKTTTDQPQMIDTGHASDLERQRSHSRSAWPHRVCHDGSHR